MEKRIKINWLAIIYRTADEKLINYFWWFYNHHRLTKNSAARCVLLSYYSTTAAPDFVKKSLKLYSDIKVAKFNLYAV